MIKIANHYVSRVVFLLLIAEICILLAASYLGVNLRFLGKGHWPSVYEQFMPSAVTFVIAMVMGMSALGMYQRNLSEGFRSTLLRLMPSFAIGLGILLIIFYVAPELYLGRGVLLEPMEPNVIVPGFALASAMYSLTDLMGTDGCTTSAMGVTVASVIGAKSLTGSYDIVG